MPPTSPTSPTSPTDEEIRAQGLLVVEQFQACAAAPDDLEAARAVEEGLARLDALLREGAAAP
ncbi:MULTISPECIES: hypothetical protein [unclassified Streptomyces]|uniref:hypothetical protein n=1 Tax=unclassified Streptomyces TaxID=2593676 RepID=UPI0036494822